MGNQNFIVINGKKYDAVTGILLNDQSDSNKKPTIERVNPTNHSGVVDGFVKPNRVKNKKHTPAAHINKQVQRSQTLVRSSVKKPANSTVKQQQPGIKKQNLGVSVRRVSLAKQVQKSPHVQKYGDISARSSVVKKNVERPVKSIPNQHNTQSNEPTSTQQHSQTSSRNSSEKMIDAALANAQSHNQEQPSKSKSNRRRLTRRFGISRRAFSISSGVLAVALLVGFFSIQNVPNLSMRLAATRAGFDAAMPEYRPSGFSFKGPIQYQPGQVTVSFRANGDDREYKFIQQKSNWNSDALLSNFIIANGKQYQTYLDRGRTLYIYDGSNATWVDDGIWYQIEGDSGMTTDQLIRMAASV